MSEDVTPQPTAETPQEGQNAPRDSEVSSPQGENAQVKQQLIELEIDGVKKSFKPAQLMNVIKSYEQLSSKAKEYTASQAQMENLFQTLRQNPEALWDFAESLGHDPRELTKQKFKQYLDYEKMTPEQKKVFELERKLSSYEKEKQKLEEERKAQAQEQLIEKYYSQIEQEFADFYQESGVKPSRELAQDLIRVQREQLELTGKRPSVKQAYQQLEKKNQALRQKLLEQLSEDDLPPELVKKIQRKLAKDARKFPPNRLSSTPSQKRPQTKIRRKVLSINDFFK